MTSDGEVTPGDELRAARRVVPGRLRWVCAPENIPDHAEAVAIGLGQDRAIAALEMGAAMKGRGYNIFAAGARGSGRTRATREVLSRIAAARPVPPDRAYVHNFVHPERPRLVTLPPGQGLALRRAMERFIELMKASLPNFFDDEIVEQRRRAITDLYGRREGEMFREFSAEAEGKGFALVKVQTGQVSRPEVVPVRDGEPVSLDKLRQVESEGAITQEEVAKVESELTKLRARLSDLVREGRNVGRELNENLERMVREEAGHMLAGPLGDIEEEFDHDGVRRFLQHVREDVLELLTAPFGRANPDPDLGEHLRLYRVNVVADRSRQTGAPVVIENFPSMVNLFGSVNPPGPQEGRRPGALDISSGTFLHADGGFLVMRAADVVREPGVWDAVKRTLSTATLEVQRVTTGPPGGPAVALKPESIPVNVRVVLVGEPSSYDLLWSADPDFRSTFKIKAEFDPVMERTDDAVARYCQVLGALCQENNLRILAPEGAARILEWSARQAGGRGKILARFGEIEDLLREADYEADMENAPAIGAHQVEKALLQRRTRNGRTEERALELMATQVIRIETSGQRVGQVNGLSVLDMGYHRFGKPVRITATTSVGRTGIINIEREARLSGGIYDKGVLIITGWLRRRYAQERALTLTASVSFEQSYSGVDGDSASIAEIIALLSELSGFPVDQSVAVTGSVDQHGGLQPIGGLNEKVEGFFDVCSAQGLTGGQGVMFPEANIEELNLREDVADAVEAGRFSLFALRSLEDALGIALDRTMAEIDSLVIARLEAYATVLEDAPADVPPVSSTVADN